MSQLVVGGTADDLGGQRVDRAFRQRAAEGARRQHVQPLRDQRVDAVDGADLRVAGADGFDGSVADVADDHVGLGLDEVVDEAVADLAHALHADGPPAQAGAAPGVLGRRAHSVHDAERGQHRGIPRAAVGRGPAGHVAAFPGDDVHVLAARADVAGGDVTAAKRGDEAAVGAQQRFGLELGRVTDDDRLAAAEVQARQCVLVGHGGGQAQHVGEGLFLACVGVEPGSAERGAELGGIDADNRP
jgi:hypothetical protein